MNDWYNDPPETPEPPECCGEMMEVDEDGDCECMTCGKLVVCDKEPAEDPRIAHGDYLYDEMKDRMLEERWAESEKEESNQEEP